MIPISQRTQAILQTVLLVLLSIDVTALTVVVADDGITKRILAGAAIVIGVLKMLLGLTAQRFNPDGTPAILPYVKPKAPKSRDVLIKTFWPVLLMLALAATAYGQQSLPQPLRVTRIYDITATWTGECGTGCIVNTSGVTRQNNYHSYWATGSGTWSVDMQYSDVGPSGPWTSFGGSAVVDQGDNPPIGYGNGYHPYVRFVITGNATLTYAAARDFFLSTSSAGVILPLPVIQGGTGAQDATAARAALGAAVSGANSDITSLSGLTTPLSVGQGGSGATDAGGARTNFGAAALGANSDITSLSGLTTPLSQAQGGTGAATASEARANLGLALPIPVNSGGTGATDASGARTNLGISLPISIEKGGTGATTAAGARLALGVSSTSLLADDYDFPAQACDATNTCRPGGASGMVLVNGVPTTLALTPCPLGVAGTNTNHYLYISGGVGTPESVLITGGTCTSGAASGTITLTTANGHSGAWTISSATAGGKEAAVLVGASGGGVVAYNSGSSALHAPLVITEHFTTVRGQGRLATKLVADLAVSPGVQFGDTSQCWSCGLEDLAVTRADGAIPAGSVGVFWKWFGYSWMHNVHVMRHARDVNTEVNSLGLELRSVMLSEATYAYLVLDNAIEITMHNGILGANGGEANTPQHCIVISGDTNDVRINSTQIIPRPLGPIPPWPTIKAISFLEYASPVGYIVLTDINTELVSEIFYSDASTPRVAQLQVSQSRLTSTNVVFDFNAATLPVTLQFANNSISTNNGTNLTGAVRSSFTGNNINGAWTVTGGDLAFSGNTFSTISTFAGTFSALAIVGNIFSYNGAAPIYPNVTGTGNITVLGNAGDAYTIPAVGGLTPGTWQAPVLNAGWVLYNTGSPVGYRKDALGTLELRGGVKNGTTADGTVLFTLPAGYRPNQNRIFLVRTVNGVGQLNVDVGGEARIYGVTDATIVSLDGIRFATN